MKKVAEYKQNERQSNIELLRILAIMGVIVLHYNNASIGGGFTYAVKGSLNFYVLYFLESIFICAVDLFVIISGYFMCNTNKRNLWKPIELIVQVMIFSFCLYIISSLLNGNQITVKHLLVSLLPKNYFVILYSCVYIISPFINVLFDKLSRNSINKMVICAFLLFSVYPTIVDVLSELSGKQIIGLSSVGMYGSQWGYTIVNFILMYTIGTYMKKCDLEIKQLSTKKLLALMCICICVLMVWARLNDRVGILGARSAWEYCNPVVIFEAVIVLLLFLRINLGTNYNINKLASGAFTVFLLHGIFIKRIGIDHYVNENIILMIIHVFASMIGIYLICFLVHTIYKPISACIFLWLSKKMQLSFIIKTND